MKAASNSAVSNTNSYDKTLKLDDYTPIVGKETIERIREKAKPLQGSTVAHVNSTHYGGGVPELLSPLTLLMNDVGIQADWRVIQGTPDFFSITKKMHNALQGDDINMTDLKQEIFESVVYENAIRNRIDDDLVIIHDPQPLLMIHHCRRRGPWIWRCHVDLSSPNKELWDYLSPHVEMYDAVILTLEEYARDLDTPQVFIMPAIDPFSIKNRTLTEDEIDERLDHYDIPSDKPLVVQISRFDKWKDPEGVIQAFKIAQEEIDARLVLLGNMASDDPEGEAVYHSLLEYQNDDIIILSREDTALVNALQRRAAVVVQKSLREGFGMTVTEAMWKGSAVVGGDVGGIRHQIDDGVNGFLTSSIEMTAKRVVQLVNDGDLRKQIGNRARERVKDNFLLTRLLEQYLDLLGSFEAIYRLQPKAGGCQDSHN
ncbi:MAG: glycosyltransferase [Anaerolineales bacterium]|jgi:trehalose synthase